MSKIKTIAKELEERFNDVYRDYFLSKRSDKNDIITYELLCLLEESVESFFASARRLYEDKIISPEDYNCALYAHRLIREKKSELLYAMHRNGFRKTDWRKNNVGEDVHPGTEIPFNGD